MDLTPLVTPQGGGLPGGRGGGVCVTATSGEGQRTGGHTANLMAVAMATPRQLTRLERVALEIVETEQAYVRDLKSIVEVRNRMTICDVIIRYSVYHDEIRDRS